jgi:hypothetical protein
MSSPELFNRFKYHPATEVTGPKHEKVRDSCYNLAVVIDLVVPDGREKSLAMTKIEEAMFWANAGIARNS